MPASHEPNRSTCLSRSSPVMASSTASCTASPASSGPPSARRQSAARSGRCRPTSSANAARPPRRAAATKAACPAPATAPARVTARVPGPGPGHGTGTGPGLVTARARAPGEHAAAVVGVGAQVLDQRLHAQPSAGDRVPSRAMRRSWSSIRSPARTAVTARPAWATRPPGPPGRRSCPGPAPRATGRRPADSRCTTIIWVELFALENRLG